MNFIRAEGNRNQGNDPKYTFTKPKGWAILFFYKFNNKFSDIGHPLQLTFQKCAVLLVLCIHGLFFLFKHKTYFFYSPQLFRTIRNPEILSRYTPFIAFKYSLGLFP